MTPPSETASTLQEDIQALLQQLAAAHPTEAPAVSIEQAIAPCVLRHSGQAVFGLEAGGRLVFVNDTACHMFGYDRENLLQCSFPDLVARTDGAWSDRWLSTDAAPPMPLDAQATRRDGVTFPIAVTGYRLSHRGEDYLCAIAEDLSGRQSVDESHVMYERALEVTPDHVSIVGPDYVYRRVNASYLRDHGLAEAEIVGQAVADLLGHDTFQLVVKPNLDRCLAGEDVTYEAWFNFRVAGRKFMHVTYSPLRTAGNRVDGVVVMARDMTDRKEAEVALRKSHDFLRQVIDIAPNLIFAKDREGRFTLVNQTVANVYGTTVEAMIGKTDADFNANHEEVEFFRQMDLEVLNTQRERVIPEELITDATGRTRWLQTVKRPILDEEGRATQVLGAATDITERKRGEQVLRLSQAELEVRVATRTQELQAVNAALRASEERLRTLYEDNPSMYFIVDRSGLVLSVNRFGAEQLGYQPHDLMNRSVYDVFLEEDRAAFANALDKAFNLPDRVHRWVFRKLAKGGRLLWVQETVRTIQDPAGTLVALIVCEDITERKEADDRVRELNLALAHAMPCTSQVDAHGRYLEVNDAYGAMLGYAPADLIGQSALITVHPDDHPQALASFERMRQAGHSEGELRGIRKDGSWFYKQVFMVSASPAGPNAGGHHCFMRDITERKAADAKVRELNLALAHAMPGISELDADGRYVEVNDAYAGMLGYRPEELLRRPAQVTVHPEDVPIAQAAYARMRAEGQAESEFRGVRKDGAWFHKQVFMVSGSTEGRNSGGYHCFMRDITERKRAQEQTLEFARIMDASHNEIFIFDAQSFQFLYVNQGAYQNLGYTIDEMLRMTPLAIKPDLTAESFLALSEPLRTGSQPKVVFTSWHRRKDGTNYPVEVHLQLATFDGRPAYIAIIMDITARKATEDALTASEKAIRALYGVTSNPKLTFEERVGALLDIGRDRFNLPIGVLTKVSNDELRVEHARASVPGIAAGMTLPLQTTFCRHALSRATPIAVEHLARSPWRSDPAYLALGMECYVGARVMVGQTVYGALGFLSPHAHPDAFTRADLEILQLMASWIGTELDRQTAELALRESRELFAVAFRASPHPIVITELLTGRTVEANDTALDVFGYRREEAIGFTTLALNLWPSQEDRQRFVERIRLEGRLRDVELPFRAKDGRWIQCRLSCEPITLRGVPCVLNVGEDITRRKEAELALRASEERFRHLFEEAPIGICIVGDDLRFRKINPTFQQLVGYSEEDILATSDALYTHPDDRPSNLALSERFLRGEIPGYTSEQRYIRKNGEVIWVTVTVSPLAIAGLPERLSLAIVQDVTARKLAEQALAHRERDLRAALEEREQVSQDLHDGILQSLYAVGLSLDAASRLMDVSSRRAKRELAGAISQLNRTLQEIRSFITGLSFDMLDVTRFTHALQSVSDAFCKSGRTRCEISAAPEAVKRLTRQQCVHLLNIVREAVSNSVRHGRASRIRVSLRRHRGHTRLTIHDNGKGFDPHADLRRGYGLRNMRSRSLNMHAKFKVQSKPDAGTTIMLALAPEESHV